MKRSIYVEIKTNFFEKMCHLCVGILSSFYQLILFFQTKRDSFLGEIEKSLFHSIHEFSSVMSNALDLLLLEAAPSIHDQSKDWHRHLQIKKHWLVLCHTIIQYLFSHLQQLSSHML